MSSGVLFEGRWAYNRGRGLISGGGGRGGSQADVCETGFLLFTNCGRSTVVVNGTSQISNGNFHWDALVSFLQDFYSEIPFGNFGLPFKLTN